MIYYIFIWKYFLFEFQNHIKQWAKPATLSLISGVISDMTRSRSDLIVENALLRQQLIVLHRQVKRPGSPSMTVSASFCSLVLRGSGNKPFILFSQTRCYAGIEICFASIGD
jgi:hypothetical protein